MSWKKLIFIIVLSPTLVFASGNLLPVPVEQPILYSQNETADIYKNPDNSFTGYFYALPINQYNFQTQSWDKLDRATATPPILDDTNLNTASTSLNWLWHWFTPTVNATQFTASITGQVEKISCTTCAWSTIYTATGNGHDSVDDNISAIAITADSSANTFQMIRRVPTSWDTSSIGTGQTIDSATASYDVDTKSNGLGSLALGLTKTVDSPQNNTSLVDSDYNLAHIDGARVANDIAYSSLTTGGYNDWSITDLTVINPTGYTKMAWRFANDIDNSAPTWTSNHTSDITTFQLTNPPKLTVTWHASGGGGGGGSISAVATTTPDTEFYQLSLVSLVLALTCFTFAIVFGMFH